MRRVIVWFSITLPAIANASSLHPILGAPGGDLSAAGADTQVTDWAEQMLNQDLAPPKAATRSAQAPDPSASPEPAEASAATAPEGPAARAPVAPAAVAANELARTSEPASSASAAAPNADSVAAEAVTTLNGVTITGRRDALQASDQRLQKTIDALPKLGDGGRVIDETPKAVILGTELVLSAARQLLFKQPRIRGEASDEALFNAQSGVCTADAPFRCLTSDKQP